MERRMAAGDMRREGKTDDCERELQVMPQGSALSAAATPATTHLLSVGGPSRWPNGRFPNMFLLIQQD